MERLVVYHPDKAAFSHRNMRNSPKRLNHKRKDFDSHSLENSYRKRFSAIDNSLVGVLRCFPHNSQLSQKPPVLPRPSNLPPSSNTSQPSAVLSSAGLGTVMRNFRKFEQEPPKRRLDGNKESESYPLITSAQPFGPDPGDLPKKVLGVFSSAEFAEKWWSGSAFSISPSPSSLPLPSFSLNHKGRCSSEATAGGSGGIDFSATESLRRLLRIH